jgi:DNA-binding HxlR family transcriptional regulator
MPTRTKEPCRTCPAGQTIAIISGRWKVPLIYHLFSGTKRFSELKQLLVPVAAKCLTEALRELERDGIVTRKLYPETPPRVEYTLTKDGKGLKRVIDEMCSWGERRR